MSHADGVRCKMCWRIACRLCMRVVCCSVLALYQGKHSCLSPAKKVLGLVCNLGPSNNNQAVDGLHAVFQDVLVKDQPEDVCLPVCKCLRDIELQQSIDCFVIEEFLTTVCGKWSQVQGILACMLLFISTTAGPASRTH